MSFNPLGNFNPDAPIIPSVLADVRASAEIPALPAGFNFAHIYLHWAVAGFGCFAAAASWLTEYNYVIDFANGKWLSRMSHNPLDNLGGYNQNPMAEHTWHRNTNAIGIAIAGMDGATETNFGPDGVQVHELEYLCATAALVAKAYNLDVMAPGVVMTHAEAAWVDRYPFERWDLMILTPAPVEFSLGSSQRQQYQQMSGDALRKRVHAYKLAA